jgi:hypothetical protein
VGRIHSEIRIYRFALLSAAALFSLPALAGELYCGMSGGFRAYLVTKKSGTTYTLTCETRGPDGVAFKSSPLLSDCTSLAACKKIDTAHALSAGTFVAKSSAGGSAGATSPNPTKPSTGNANTSGSDTTTYGANTSTTPSSNTTSNDLAAIALENYRNKNGIYQGTVQGNGYKIVPGPDGNGAILYTSGPNAGKMFDQPPSAGGQQVHAGREYVANGKTYPDHASWLSANGQYGKGAEVKNYEANTITTYENGRPMAKYAMNADGSRGRQIMSVEEEMKKEKDRAKNGDKKAKKADECEASMRIDPSFSCNSTHAIAKATEIGNQVLTSQGRNMINQMGGTAAQRAQNGTQSSVHEGAAKMAKTGFTYETALTVANTAAAYSLSKKAAKHGQNLQELRNRRDAERTVGDGASSEDINAALIEQAQARDNARTNTYKAAMVGLQSAAAAKVAKNMQKDAEKNAALSRSIEKKLSETGVVFNAGGMTADGTQTGVTPGGETDPGGMGPTGGLNPNSDPNAGAGGPPSLGSGNDLGAGDDSGPGMLPAGKFKAADSSGGGGGGGGAMGGGAGAGGAAPAAAAEDPKAQYATEFGTKERYESGGSPGAAAKGAAKAGGKDDGGIDLNGLLAQFLPKNEEDLGPKNGILDFAGFGGGRAPASAEEAPSYLDKNADLFQRIHETYAEKNRKGHVGL